jgi:hypothetical protein
MPQTLDDLKANIEEKLKKSQKIFEIFRKLRIDYLF